MTLEEVKKEKVICEEMIKQALDHFHNTTGLTVTAITYTSADSFGAIFPVSVDLEVKL